MPERVQLSRRRGWRKPENTVVVVRPSKWGNPFTVEEFGHVEAVRKYRLYIEGRIRDGHLDIGELRGKNLACWCALPFGEPNPEPCHADVLLELANTPTH